jgi:hypothetical protein
MPPTEVPVTPGTTRSPPRTNSNSVKWIVFGALAVGGTVLVVFLATLWFGARGGEEFSPTTFSRRSFYYYEIPLLGIQVIPIVRDDKTNDLETLLQTKNYVASQPPAAPRWDLVMASHSGMPVFHGDASILCNYLDATDEDGSRFWKTWTEKQSNLAAVFWPVVARVAHQQLYLFVPQLFELTSAESDPKRLAGSLARSLAQQYRRLAEMHQDLGDHKTALELLNEALRHAPQDRHLTERRAESLRALGNTAN